MVNFGKIISSKSQQTSSAGNLLTEAEMELVAARREYWAARIKKMRVANSVQFQDATDTGRELASDLVYATAEPGDHEAPDKKPGEHVWRRGSYIADVWPESSSSAYAVMKLSNWWFPMVERVADGTASEEEILIVERGKSGMLSISEGVRMAQSALKIEPVKDEKFLTRLQVVSERLADTPLGGSNREGDRKKIAKLDPKILRDPDNERALEDAELDFENRLNKIEWLLKPQHEGGEGWPCDTLTQVGHTLKLPKKIRKRLRPLTVASSGNEIRTLAKYHASEDASERKDIEPIVQQLEQGAVTVSEAEQNLKLRSGYARDYPERVRAYIEGAPHRIKLLASKASELKQVAQEITAWCESISDNPGQPAGVMGHVYRMSKKAADDMDAMAEAFKKSDPFDSCGSCAGQGAKDDGKPCGYCGGQGWLNYGMAQAAKKVSV